MGGITTMKLVPVNAKESMLWLTDAVTMFVNGFVAGIGTGTFIGGAAAAQSDTMDPQSLSVTAAIGLLLAASANGIKRVVVWQDTHPFPNPFRLDEPPILKP